MSRKQFGRVWLAPMWLFLAAPALAGEVRLVPVDASIPFRIQSQEIMVGIGGARITLEVYVSDWDPDHDGDPLLNAYQAHILSSGFVSGTTGQLALAEIPCQTDDDCQHSLLCGTQVPGFCDVGPYHHPAVYVDMSRPDFLLNDPSAIAATDVSRGDPRFVGILLDSDQAVADTGGRKYAATLILDVSPDATGTFTVGFHPTETVLFGPNSMPIGEPLTLTPVLITLTNDCNGNGIDDAEDIAGNASDDCNANGTPDECEPDCNGNGAADDCDIDTGASDDCDENSVPDECEWLDCNDNDVLDVCDVATNASPDCDDNGIPDECELRDCNGNGIMDGCDVAGGFSPDCNSDGVPDECEEECTGNGIPDECDLAAGTSADCDTNGVPDECEWGDCNDNGLNDRCEVADGTAEDLNGNGLPDDCDVGRFEMVPVAAEGIHFIAGQEVQILPGGRGITFEIRIRDWDMEHEQDPLLSAYQAQLDLTGLVSEVAGQLTLADVPCQTDVDCHHELSCGIQNPGVCDSTSYQHSAVHIDVSRPDYVMNVPTELNAVDPSMPEPRYAGLTTDPAFAVADTGAVRYAGTLILDASDDATGTFTVGFHPTETFLLGVDHMRIADPVILTPALVKVIDDCNDNGRLDSEDIALEYSQDCNDNGFPDECDVSFGITPDCNGNGQPDGCELSLGSGDDCNENGVLDECDVSSGTGSDCNDNAILDECEPAEDCNQNGNPDFCDLATGASPDTNGNGVPDECDYRPPTVTPLGCRYLELTPAPADESVAMRITSPDWPCLERYVRVVDGLAWLSDAPMFLPPAEWGTVTVMGWEITPGTRYEIRTWFDSGIETLPTEVTTAIWGDTVGMKVDGVWTPPNGIVDIADTVAILLKFISAPSAPPLEWVDIEPRMPDGVINITDALYALFAFQHRPYPFAGPCP